MDEIAKLYVRVDGSVYRIKVFETTVGVERQPNGDNKFYSRYETEIYDDATGVWDYKSIGNVINIYRFGDDSDSDLLISVNDELPSIQDIAVASVKAKGYFKFSYDGGGEWVLWYIDQRASQAGRHNEPVERHIKTYGAIPEPEAARSDALAWLDTNADWL